MGLFHGLDQEGGLVRQEASALQLTVFERACGLRQEGSRVAERLAVVDGQICPLELRDSLLRSFLGGGNLAAPVGLLLKGPQWLERRGRDVGRRLSGRLLGLAGSVGPGCAPAGRSGPLRGGLLCRRSG